MTEQLNDEPTFDDKLNRQTLLTAIGQAIAKCSPPQVFAVHGDWGSGKTSFLQQLRYELDGIGTPSAGCSLTKSAHGDQLVTVWFEAWRYQNESAPVVALLQEMRRQLGTSEKIKKELGKLAEVTTKTLLNGIDDVAKLLKLESLSTKGAQAAGESWEKEHLTERLASDSVRSFLTGAINGLLGPVDIQVSHTNAATKAMKEAKREASFS